MTIDENDVFEFLDGVREDGGVNMFGAGYLIEDMFETAAAEARSLLVKWMEQFDNKESI